MDLGSFFGSGEFQEKSLRISQRILPIELFCDFFGLVSLGSEALPKNQRPKFTPKTSERRLIRLTF